MASTEKKEQELPARELKLQIKTDKVDNTYSIQFPNVAKQIDYEWMKANIADGRYQSIGNSGTMSGAYTKVLIDMIAAFETFIPQIKKDMNVNSYLDLDPMDTKILMKAYTKQFLPWYNKWLEFMNDFGEDEDQENE